MRVVATAFAASLLGSAGAVALAQAPADAAQLSGAECPVGPVSIYFASGDVTPSPQSRAVLDKIRHAADACATDQIEVVAHVDAAEGPGALRFALQRLQLVSDRLVALGLPATRIRTATDAPDSDQRTDVGRRQIDIMIGRPEDRAPAVPADAPRRAPPIPENWI